MKKIANSIAIIALLNLLAACGDRPGERAISGGGLGAGAGAAVGALTGGSAVSGALIGGALGAAGGGLTSSKDIDLGKPIWK